MAFLKTLLFLGAVSGQALASEAPIPGYGVAKLPWNIHLLPGDTPINLTGTIEQVYAQIKDLNPRWAQDLERKRSLAAAAAAGNDQEAHLLARAEPLKVYCSSRAEKWGYAETEHVNRGIAYLSEIDGKPFNGPGPGMCARVSCAYRTSIWWCNDNDHDFELDSYKDVAYGTQAIVDKCARGYQRSIVKGQAFMPGDWNVVVRREMANC
ncbi:hypothetical protein E4U21_000696 [Claviceps maximensis]|nr:hypothetical protein E4U21_000696 [Claviceps maximensis]